MVRCQFQDVRHGKRRRRCWSSFQARLVQQCPGHLRTGRTPRQLIASSATIESAKPISWPVTSRPHERGSLTGAAFRSSFHDTTEFSFKREDGRGVGILQKLATRYASQGATSISHQLRHLDAFQPGGNSPQFWGYTVFRCGTSEESSRRQCSKSATATW